MSEHRWKAYCNALNFENFPISWKRAPCIHVISPLTIQLISSMLSGCGCGQLRCGVPTVRMYIRIGRGVSPNSKNLYRGEVGVKNPEILGYVLNGSLIIFLSSQGPVVKSTWVTKSQRHLVPSEMWQKSFKILQENATLTIHLKARDKYHAFLQRHCRRCDPGRALST